MTPREGFSLNFNTETDTAPLRLLAFDLDGTLTQHKSPLDAPVRALLEALSKRYRLLMVGAGSCRRIFEQMGRFPIDIIGNYGMEAAAYDPETGDLRPVFQKTVPCDREKQAERVAYLREKYGFTAFAGDSVEYHASGCVTFPILGTKAQLPDKLAFDPDRSRRRAILPEVRAVFSDYNVFVGGTSSFDMSPAGYTKYEALCRYADENGYAHGEILFFGDDFGPGGNDESVYSSDIAFQPITHYTEFPRFAEPLLKEPR